MRITLLQTGIYGLPKEDEKRRKHFYNEGKGSLAGWEMAREQLTMVDSTFSALCDFIKGRLKNFAA